MNASILWGPNPVESMEERLRRQIGRVMAILMLLVLTSCGGIGRVIRTSCVVAARGSAVVIEVAGTSAESECQNLIDSGDYYASEPQEEKSLICVVELSGLKYTVRDQGAFNLVGNSVCNELTARIPIPTITPAPTSQTAILCAVGVPGHDAMIEVYGTGARQSCQILVEEGFESRGPDPDMEVLCVYDFSDGTWTVRDTGGMIYGSDICEDLDAGRLPSP